MPNDLEPTHETFRAPSRRLSVGGPKRPGPTSVADCCDAPTRDQLLPEFPVNLKPGITTTGYINALTRRLGTTSYFVRTPAGPSIAFNIQPSYFHRLAVLAALGVLNSVLMATRERLHDLGIYKALGMTPRQIIAMVLCWVIAPTIVAATVALPVGLIVQDRLIVHPAAVTGPLILPRSCRPRPRPRRAYAAHPRRADDCGSRSTRTRQPGRRIQSHHRPAR